MEEIIRESVVKYLSGNDEVEKIVSLYGDASYRTYFRVYLKSGKSMIAMKMPQGIASASEEITNYKGPKEELPFIEIAKLFKKNGLPVADIYFYDKEKEVLLLEDLGNHVLYKSVQDASDDEKLCWYKKSIDLLVALQQKLKDDNVSIASKRSFDETLLNWEFDHFLEYGIEANLGIQVSTEDKKRFEFLTRKITDKILSFDYGFVHRDFQSKNLMVKEGVLYLIDFQDALKGPRVYDLVALLRDSYVDISDSLLKKLLAYYSEKIGIDISEVEKEFDLMTIQRKLKDAGRFVYIDRVKGNPDFLQHIPRSLKYVRKAIERVGEAELFELLKPYVKDWKKG